MTDRGDVLPRIEISMTRRHLSEDDAEQLEIKLTARRPASATPLPHPALAWACLGLAPVVAWQAMWLTFLSGPGAAIRACEASGAAEPARITGPGAANVRPFPGPEQR